MRFQITCLFAIFCCITAATSNWIDVKNLPDGPYDGVNNADGSTTLISLENGEKYTFAPSESSREQQKRSGSTLQKRFVSCWGYQLDHGGVDDAVVQLKEWAGTGRDWHSNGNKPDYRGFNSRGVYVYYCINAGNSQGNVDVRDIDYALGQMDSQCQRYEAGYFQWPQSVELVGKCRSGTAVCLG